MVLVWSKINYIQVFSESIPDGFEVLSLDILGDCTKFRTIKRYRSLHCSVAFHEQLVKKNTNLAMCGYPVNLFAVIVE